MTTDLTLNGVALSAAVPTAAVLAVRRPLLAGRRHQLAAVPGRAGAWRFDEEPADRVIEVDVDIQAASFAARRAAVTALAGWLDVGTTADLVIDDEPDRYHDALAEDPGNELERLLNAAATIRLLVGPYAKAITISTSSLAATGSSPATGTIVHTDAIYAEPVIELTPNDGTLTGFTLTIGPYSLTWAGDAVASGETITVSSITDTVTRGPNDDVNLTGAIDTGDIDMLDVSGEWPLLLVGSNPWSLEWAGTATDITIDLTWRERYR